MSTAAGREEQGALVGAESQHLRQLANGPWVGRGTHPTFQIGDATGAQSGPLGELLLSEPGRCPVAPKELTKPWQRVDRRVLGATA